MNYKKIILSLLLVSFAVHADKNSDQIKKLEEMRLQTVCVMEQIGDQIDAIIIDILDQVHQNDATKFSPEEESASMIALENLVKQYQALQHELWAIDNELEALQ